MKVLIVDDEQSVAEIFAQTLKQEGFEVLLASNGKEGIEKAKTPDIDLILLDQILPDINGNDVLKTLKQDPTTSKIPVAMLSNYSQDTFMQEAIKLGAIDYILKYQIEAADLKLKVKEIIQEAQARQSTPPMQPDIKPEDNRANS